MALPVFTPPISPSAADLSQEINLLEAEFGDGYTQAVGRGMNHMRRTVTLTWDLLELEEKAALVAFLEARKGFESFLYRVPNEPTAIQWTCKEWSAQARPAQLYALTATLRQSFAL